MLKTNLVIIVSMLVLLCIVYYLLLDGTYLHTSISEIIAQSHHFARENHVLVLGFLPIYIALMIFGAGIVGLCLGKRIHRYFFQRR